MNTPSHARSVALQTVAESSRWCQWKFCEL